MWGLIANLAIGVGLYLINRYLAPQPLKQPLRRDNLTVPRIDEGSPKPLVFGRCRVNSPILSLTSYLQSDTISNNGQPYIAYALDMLFVVGIPMGSGVAGPTTSSPESQWLKCPKLHTVWLGDQQLPAPASGQLPCVINAGTINAKMVNQPAMLGGPGAGGGLTGIYRWFGGYTDQDLSSYPIGGVYADVLPSTAAVPGHRGQMCVSFSHIDETASDIAVDASYSDAINPYLPFYGFSVGESPNIDGFAFEVSTYGDMLFSMANPGYDFGGDADPAEVLWDLLTNPWSKLGIDTAKLDSSSFAAASATLLAEAHGYSNAISSADDIKNTIGQILSQINGTLYYEPTNGLITLGLIRFDYNPATVVSFGPDDIVSVDEYTMGTWRDTINEVRVVYTSRANNYTATTAVAQSLGSAIANNNRRKPKTIEYPGITNATLAGQVAARDLRSLSQPLATAKITFNASARDLRPGKVFKASYPEANIAGVIFRVQTIDLGQLEQNKVVVQAVQDAFVSTYAGMPRNPGLVQFGPPNPLTTRTIVESPRWLNGMAVWANPGVTQPDLTHFLALPAPSSGADKFTLQTRQNTPVTTTTGIGVTSFVPINNGTVQQTAQNAIWKNIGNVQAINQPFWQTDIGLSVFPISFTLVGNYARENEPYDTSVGIQITGVNGGAWSQILAGPGVSSFTIDSASEIQKYGRNLVMLVTPTGGMEIIAFESMTDLGGGNYRLNNIWRGLLDTPPIAHVAGERGVFVSTAYVGTRGWNVQNPVAIKIIPASPFVTSSGEDPVDSYTGQDETDFTFLSSQIAGRAVMPLPPSDLAIDGDYIAQNAGLYVPLAGLGSNGHYKALPFLEEAFDVYGYQRDRLSATIHKGSDANDTLNDAGITYFAAAGLSQSVVAPSSNSNAYAFYAESLSTTPSPSPLGGQALAGGGYRVSGYGFVDVSLAPERTLGTSDPLVGVGGLVVGQTLGPWRYPRCTVFMPYWRNLLGNARFRYRGGSTDCWWDTPHPSGSYSWTTVAGGADVFTGGSTSGTFAKANSTTSPQYLAQFNYIDGYQLSGQPTGIEGVTVASLSPYVWFFASCYVKNLNSNTHDTGQMTVEGNAGNHNVITSTFSTASVVGLNSHWSNLQVANKLGSATQGIRCNLISTKVLGGSANPDTAWCETELRIGQLAQSGCISNGSFETFATPNFSSWTNDTANFIQVSTTGGSANACECAAATAAAQMHQDFVLPDGHQYLSTFVLTFFCKSTQLLDRGQVTLECLDGSNTVLSTVATESINLDANLNAWTKRTMYIPIVNGTAKVRTILNVTRGSGNTNCTFQFDEMNGLLWDDMPVKTSISASFAQPSVEPVPTTWQEFALAYPGLTAAVGVPDLILNGADFGTNQISYSDHGPHATAYVAGQFGNGTTVIAGYSFVYGTGSSAVHAHATGTARATLGNYSLAQPFTVSVSFRTEYLGAWPGAVGLIGRMDLAAGWGIGIDASGHGYALLRGAGATSKTCTVSTQALNDGARHRLTLVNDPVAQLLWIYDELGNSASVSTASGLGEIAGSSTTQHLRIGRDADDHAVMPGSIDRVYAWSDEALTSAQVKSLWNYAVDPSGLITTYTRTAAAIAIGGYDTAGNRTAYVVSAAQVAQPYYHQLTVDSGSGYALALGKSATNLVPTSDFTQSATWVKGATATLTTGVVSSTGRLQACTVVGDASNGLAAHGITLAASPATVVVVFMAKASTGTPSLDVNLRDSTGALKGTQAVTLGTTWERYAVTVSGWTGSTATGWIEFISASGALTFSLSEAIYVGQGTDIPALLPLANATHGNYNATITTTLDQAFNSRGEIVVVGSAMIDSPTTAVGAIVQVKNGSNTKNERELQIVSGSTGFRLAHTDGAASPATVNSTIAYSTYADRVWTARGRWSRAGLLDNISPQSFAEVTYTDSSTVLPTMGGAGRTAAWTNDTTPSTTILLGTGTASPSDVLIRSATVQWPESRIA